MRPDSAGFPLLESPNSGFGASLWPLAKVQWEAAVSQNHEPLQEEPINGDINGWYEELLAASPRVSWPKQRWGKALRGGTPKPTGSVWLTGILSGELEFLADCFSDNFRLPTVTEWQIFYRRLSQMHLFRRDVIKHFETTRYHPAAHHFANEILKATPLENWADFALLNRGSAEIALRNDGLFSAEQYVALGQVRGTLWNAETQIPLPTQRDSRFGIRLFRSLT